MLCMLCVVRVMRVLCVERVIGVVLYVSCALWCVCCEL